MKTWFISDTHFGHANIVEFCQRPFRDVSEMDQELVRRWNARVGADDEVYHLGDFAFGTADNIGRMLEQLHGRVHLIRGNHDRSNKRMLSFGFASAHDALEIPYAGWTGYDMPMLLKHKPMEPTKERPLVLCGHVHNNWRERNTPYGRIINVGVDVRDFEPKTLEELLK